MNKCLPSLPDELKILYFSQLQSLPGISGESRQELGDFTVEEEALYEPSDEGEHCYLWIEKQGISTRGAIRKLSRALGKRERDFGYAGLKDAAGITRQYLSIVHKGSPEELLEASSPKIQILSVKRHKNKLRVGHLKGNQFQLRLRDCADGDLERAEAILAALKERGIPNYFGLQRFGDHFNSHILGRHLITGQIPAFLSELLGPRPESQVHEQKDELSAARLAFENGDLEEAVKLWPKHQKAESSALRSLVKVPGDTERAVRAIPQALRFFYGNAFQSYLFNRYLSICLEGSKPIHPGSIALLDKNGAAFEVEDLEKERPRFQSFELHPSGPMFGAKLLRPKENSADWEIENGVLEDAGLSMSDLENSDLKLNGMRRALRIPLQSYQLKEGEAPGTLELCFSLPKGCYATSVLGELFQKPVL
ncbi:MAG: tRNA pseudouridine(13) synthase TruD [Planctomycetota bacterium]|nr:tRNA pseudouridine(13) synthase TruD [Planctomycetota bacterium]